MDNFSTKEVMDNLLKKNPVVRQCIPLGYAPGFPLLSIKNDCLCFVIPFLKSKVTGVVDKTLIYPIRYVLTLELPTLKVVSFVSLEYVNIFSKVDFDRPISMFRHEALRNVGREEYRQLVQEFYGEYDKIVNYLIFGGERESDGRMTSLARKLIDPKLLPFYRILDSDFYEKYLLKN